MISPKMISSYPRDRITSSGKTSTQNIHTSSNKSDIFESTKSRATSASRYDLVHNNRFRTSLASRYDLTYKSNIRIKSAPQSEVTPSRRLHITSPSKQNSCCRLSSHHSNRIYRPKHTRVEGSKNSIDRLSLFLSKVADESGDGFSAATQKATAKLSRIYFRLIEYMAATDKRMSQSFVSLKPPSLKNGSLEHITSSDYKCRIYIKRIFHPASCIMISGSRSGLPHGHVFVKRNPNLTSEEQQILKEESNDVLDNRGFISPKKMLSWLTPTMLKAVDELVSWDSHHRVDPSSPRSSRHSFRDFVGVRTQVTDCNTVKLFIPCNRDELVPHCDQYESDNINSPMLTMVFVPTLRGHWNWPVGTHLQHAYPKTPPYGKMGKSYIKYIDELNKDGESLFLLEPSSKLIILNHPLTTSKYSGTSWSVSFYPVNIMLYKSLFDLKLSWNIENVIAIMRTLRKAHSWDKLTKQVITTCILWTMKRKLIHVHNLADFVLKLLDCIRSVAQQRFCPCFLMPSVNILCDLKLFDSRRISFDISMLQSRIITDPSQVLTYIGYHQTMS